MSIADAGRADDSEVTLYTVADSRFFLGLVGLVNSLRLTGFRHPIVVLDCGLTAVQRERVAGQCRLVAPPAGMVHNHAQYKAFAHLLRPAGTIVIIDSDMIVTRSLEPLLQLAREGKICAFPDLFEHKAAERWFPEWQQLFDLRAPLRREVYVNSGFACWSTGHWPGLLERWWQCCERTFAHRTIYEGVTKAHPFALADQDAFNALIMSEVPASAVARQPAEEEVFRKHLHEVEIADPVTLACRYRGHPVLLLHATNAPKPWQRRGWRRLHAGNAYVRLLRRLLNGSDVAVRPPDAEVPIWLRSGPGGRAGAALLQASDWLLRAILLPRRAIRQRARAG
jgi:hypothetical protein